MNYFTPDLLTRINSLDEETSDKADDDWELAIKRYNRRMARIKDKLPGGARQFEDNPICLHDARLLRMARNGDSLVMVLETEPPAQSLVVLTFVMYAEPEIDRFALPGRSESDWVEWEYEEWDVDRSGRCSFEVLFSNGWSVKLPVRDFHFVIGQQILPSGNGTAGRTSKKVVPQSA